jgi:hypothetical protein
MSPFETQWMAIKCIPTLLGQERYVSKKIQNGADAKNETSG